MHIWLQQQGLLLGIREGSLSKRFPVALNGYMYAVFYQLSEKVSFHVGFHDAAGEVDGEDILKAYNGTVGPGGKGLPHINIKPFDIRLHVLRNL